VWRARARHIYSPDGQSAGTRGWEFARDECVGDQGKIRNLDAFFVSEARASQLKNNSNQLIVEKGKRLPMFGGGQFVS
jgi:hypothetical protein